MRYGQFLHRICPSTQCGSAPKKIWYWMTPRRHIIFGLKIKNTQIWPSHEIFHVEVSRYVPNWCTPMWSQAHTLPSFNTSVTSLNEFILVNKIMSWTSIKGWGKSTLFSTTLKAFTASFGLQFWTSRLKCYRSRKCSILTWFRLYTGMRWMTYILGFLLPIFPSRNFCYLYNSRRTHYSVFWLK